MLLLKAHYVMSTGFLSKMSLFVHEKGKYMKKQEPKYLIHNRFDFVIRDAETDEVLEKHSSYNIILNTFWGTFLSEDNRGALKYIQVGSGIIEPVATDTALGNRLNGKAATNITMDVSTFGVDRIIKRKSQIRLEATENVGTTISEVGMATGASSGLVTKSLLKDINGNPISIVKTGLTIIDIYATFFVYIPESLLGGYLRFYESSRLFGWLLAIEYNSFNRYAMTYNDYSDFDTFITTPNLGASVSAGSLGYAVDAVSKKITLTIPDLAAASGNIGGYTCLILTPGIIIKLPCPGFISPKIIKEVIGTGDGSRTSFKSVFGRLRNDGSAKVYVNDIESSGVFFFRNYPSKITLNTTFFKYIMYDGGYQWYEFINPDVKKVLKIINPTASTILIYSTMDTQAHKYEHAIGANSEYSVPLGRQLDVRWDWSQQTNYKNARFIVEGVNYPDVTLDTPPSTGSVVALTYTPECIAKDSASITKSVSVSLTFGEYAPE